MIDRVFSYIFWRIFIWILEVILTLFITLMRAALRLLEEPLEIVFRVIGRLLCYPESWAVIAVGILWALTDHGLLASTVALAAVGAVLVGALVRAPML